jgi:hypothetical protein
VLDGVRYDVGDMIGYLKTVIDFALKRDDLKWELMEYLAKMRLALENIARHDFGQSLCTTCLAHARRRDCSESL